jgi:hypothetical protein
MSKPATSETGVFAPRCRARTGCLMDSVVDGNGFLWSAQWYGSCVVRYDPDGKAERRIPVPAKQVACITFGGPQLATLYITTAGQSEPMPVRPPGYDAETGPFGGPLYRFEVGIRGLPDLETDISLARCQMKFSAVLIGMAWCACAQTLGWNVTPSAEKSTLTISHDALGIVLNDVRLNVKTPAGLVPAPSTTVL